MNTLTLLAILVTQASSPFAGDARLEGAITYGNEVEPLRAVMEGMSKRTGVELRAAPAIAEDLIVLGVKDVPASEVLAKIAKHFDWEWSKRGDGYTLGPRPGWETRERAQIEEAIYQLMLPVVELAKTRLEKRKAANTPEANAKIQQLKRALAELYETATEEDAKVWEQAAKLESELEAMLSLRSPEAEFAQVLISSLDRNSLINLARRARVVYSLYPTAAQSPMPLPAAPAANRLVRELIVARLESEAAAERGDDGGVGGRSDWTPTTKFSIEEVFTVRASVEAQPEDIIRRGGWAARITMAIVGKNGRVLWSGGEYIATGSNDPYGVTLRGIDGEIIGPESNEPPAPPRGPTDVLRGKIALEGELAKALSGRSAFSEGPTPDFIEFLKKGSSVDPLATMTKVGPLAAEAANVSFISDAYDMRLMAGIAPVGDSAGAIFESMAVTSRSNWTYEGGWVSMRNEWPALARAATVPRSLLFRYRDLAADQIGLTVDQIAQFSTELSDLQFASGVTELLFALLGMFDSMDVTTAYAARAWAAMNPMERAAVRGDGIAYGRLSPKVQSNLSAFLYRVGESWRDRGFAEMLDSFGMGDGEDIEHIQEAILQGLREPEAEGLSGVEDREITQILPHGPGPEAILLAQGKPVPAVSVQVQFGDVKFPWTLPVVMIAMVKMMADGELGDYGGGPAIAFDGYRPAVGDSVNLVLTFLPEKKASVLFLGLTAVPGTEFGPFESLPQSTRSEVERAIARAKKMFGGFAQPPPPPGN